MTERLFLCLVLCLVLGLAVSCGTTPAPTSPPPTSAPPTSPPPTSPPPTSPPGGSTSAAPTATSAQPTSAPAGAPMSFSYPSPPTGLPPYLPPAQPRGRYVAFAWNDLGMHCYQKDFSMFLILPPYNVFWTQVVARADDPSIVRGGVTVDYTVPQHTNETAFSNFWTYAGAYGFDVQPGIGLTGKGVSGTMDAAGDHFTAVGVPLVDFNDDGTWDPYPMFIVDVKDSSGNQIAQTVNVAPVSTEMSCYLCHPGDTIQASMASILQSHDRNQGTSLLSQAQGGKPVLCNTCHADPAMGVNTSSGSSFSLSAAMHTFHADKMTGSNVPSNECYACHPGPQTQCLRGVMAQAAITCHDCHGTMADVGSTSRTPWVNMPDCAACHTTSLTRPTTVHITDPNQHLTPDAASLYRNSKAHGGGGIYCEACHGSTHAVYPSMNERDNQQSIRLQGQAGFISDCTVCHTERPDESFWHFRSQRGGDD